MPTTINKAPINVVILSVSSNKKYPAVAAKTSDKYFIGVTNPVSAIRNDWVRRMLAYPPANPNTRNKNAWYNVGKTQPLTIVVNPIAQTI